MSDSMESANIDLDLFIGTNQSKIAYKRKHNIADTPADKEEAERMANRQDSTGNPKTVLSKETLTKIDDETMTILRRTRCAHDYEEVFMQSSLEFYDQYYNDTEISPELLAARQIRRMYTSSYQDYLEAIDVRNAYIDTLIEKYGGEAMFMQKYQSGMINDWIPPMPKLSKRAEGYEMYQTGIIPTPCETLPEEEKLRIYKEIMDAGEEREIIESGGVNTSYGDIREIMRMYDEEYYGGSYNRYNGSSDIKSLDELNKVFKSWYRTDDNTDDSHELFKYAPENIQKRFDEWRPYREPGLLSRMVRGEEIEEPEINMNEQVTDEVTGRTMTRREYENRKYIRFLSEYGWSESRLLRYQNIGSSLDKMKRKTRANKRRRRNHEFDYDGDIRYYGEEDTGVDPMYSDNDDVLGILSGLMRGD